MPNAKKVLLLTLRQFVAWHGLREGATREEATDMWAQRMADDIINTEVHDGVTYMPVRQPTEIISEESMSKRRKVVYDHGEIDVAGARTELQKMQSFSDGGDRDSLMLGIAVGIAGSDALLLGHAVVMGVGPMVASQDSILGGDRDLQSLLSSRSATARVSPRGSTSHLELTGRPASAVNIVDSSRASTGTPSEAVVGPWGFNSRVGEEVYGFGRRVEDLGPPSWYPDLFRRHGLG